MKHIEFWLDHLFDDMIVEPMFIPFDLNMLDQTFCIEFGISPELALPLPIEVIQEFKLT